MSRGRGRFSWAVTRREAMIAGIIGAIDHERRQLGPRRRTALDRLVLDTPERGEAIRFERSPDGFTRVVK